jgi:ribose 5-phosphate isomerase A
MRNKGGRRKTSAVASVRRNGYWKVMAQEMDRDAQKRAAAEAAAALVEDGMVVGLGTGSTAWFAIEALIRRVREGLRILAIPTSERSGAQARAGGIPLTSFAEHPRLDIDIDGADEVELGSLHLIKGLGGALLREKIVAAAADRLIVVADPKKLVERLGATSPLPIEVVPFGWETTAARLERLGTEPVLRKASDGQPFRTDGGNLILDCRFGPIADPASLDLAIRQTIGVVETGLFIGMADTVIVAGDGGIVRYSRAGAAVTRTP